MCKHHSFVPSPRRAFSVRVFLFMSFLLFTNHRSSSLVSGVGGQRRLRTRRLSARVARSAAVRHICATDGARPRVLRGFAFSLNCSVNSVLFALLLNCLHLICDVVVTIKGQAGLFEVRLCEHPFITAQSLALASGAQVSQSTQPCVSLFRSCVCVCVCVYNVLVCSFYSFCFLSVCVLLCSFCFLCSLCVAV